MLLFVAAFQHQRVVAADAVVLGAARVAVRVDEFVAEASVVRLQLGQQQFEFGVFSPLHKGEGVDVPVQCLERLHRQVGEAVQLALSQVEALGIAVAQKIDHGHNAKDHDTAPKGVEPAAVLAEKRRIEQAGRRHHQGTEGQVEKPNRAALGIEQIGQAARDHQRRADQPQGRGICLHAQRLHLRDSMTRVVKNKQKNVKLR